MRKPAAPWFCLAVVLGLFLLVWARLGPEQHFGRYHDDTLYFSSAQSLAEGRGYLLPSVPGSPPQTKYPVLYPWLLSWIWKWQPQFPANLKPAVWLTALFACWFLIAAFEFLRKLGGFSDWKALALVALCAFHPSFLWLSCAVLSDMPFMALALTALVVADPALRPGGSTRRLAVAGILAGLSVLTRALGVTVIAGILATAAIRRTRRPVAVFCLAAAPFLAGGAIGLTGRASASAWGEEGGPGWRQTRLFYSSYWGFWKLSVPNRDVFQSMVSFNLTRWLERPSTFCLFPPPGGGKSFAGLLLGITLSLGILSGAVRQARGQGWKPIHLFFVFYSTAALLWNYTLMDRLLLLFLPLFYAGLWVEGAHVLSMVRRGFATARPLADRVVAGVLGAAVAGILLWAARYYAAGLRSDLPVVGAKRAALAQEKAQLYDWIRQNTNPKDRFIAYEDALLYLHTGRAALRPIAFSTEAFYRLDEKVLERDLARITDTARRIQARYWVGSEDDFHLETGLPLIEKKMGQLTSLLPVVFRSREKKVALYDLSCLHAPDRPACRPAGGSP